MFNQNRKRVKIERDSRFYTKFNITNFEKKYRQKINIYTRSSACVPAVADTHAPGRGEGVEGLGGW